MLEEWTGIGPAIIKDSGTLCIYWLYGWSWFLVGIISHVAFRFTMALAGIPLCFMAFNWTFRFAVLQFVVGLYDLIRGKRPTDCCYSCPISGAVYVINRSSGRS